MKHLFFLSGFLIGSRAMTLVLVPAAMLVAALLFHAPFAAVIGVGVVVGLAAELGTKFIANRLGLE